MQSVYLFEAKGIQRYLLESGRLKDVIGASESVAKLASSNGEDLLQVVLDGCGLKPDRIRLSRRASASFMAHGAIEDLVSLRETWRLVVQLALPGLEFSDTLLAESDAIRGIVDLKQAAYRAGSGVRENGTATLLPLGTPFHAYVARTGRVAAHQRKTGRQDIEGRWTREPLDQLVWSQHQVFQALRRADETVAQRFLSRHADAAGAPYVFPRNLEPSEDEPDSATNPRFPFVGGVNWIGFVHADVSGLGEMWRNLSIAEKSQNDPQPEASLAISVRIERAIEQAAKGATERFLIPASEQRTYDEAGSDAGRQMIVPARPLVLGGDDLTIIVRSDLAMKFARELLTNIEVETRKAFDELRQDLQLAGLASSLPSHLSACAGVAFARASQPFQMTSTLAEALCKFAKQDAKALPRTVVQQVPSAVAFHVVSTSLQEDFEREIMAVDQTLPDSRLLTSQPLYIAPQSDRTTCEALDRLVAFLDKQEKGRGKLRSLRPLLFIDPDAADRAWTRWREVAGLQRTAAGPLAVEAREECSDLLTALGCRLDDRVPFRTSTPASTPLFDALELLDLGHEPA